MFLKTLRSDNRYFKYIFKRFLPYTLIMTFTLLAINLLVYALGNSYRVGQALYLIDISIPTQIFMYVMPLVLGCAQFRFLFTRNGSDFFGAMPSTRAEIFNANILSGLASILIVIGVNTLYFAVSMPLVHPDVMIAPTTYLWYFAYWFVAYAVTFAVTAFAATLSGTTLAQLVLTFVTVITPGFFITAFQSVCASYLGLGSTLMSNNVITSATADVLIKVLFAPYYPVQELFFIMFGYERYTGMFYDIQTFPMLICNLIMLIVFIYAGAKLLRRRKFELAGSAYPSEKLYAAVKILAVFPFIFIMLRILAESSEFWIFMLFMIMITVLYILMDICLRKGLTKIKLSLITYLISFVFTLAVFFGIGGISALINGNNIYVPQANITSVTVYMEPAGLSFSEGYVSITKAGVPIKLTDDELIEEFKKSAKSEDKGGGSFLVMRINVNGRSLLGRYYVTDGFMNRLYGIIESDETLLAKLDYTEKRKQNPLLVCVSTRGTSYVGSYYRGGYSGFKISNKEARNGLLGMLDAQNAKKTLPQRYGNEIVDIAISENSSSLYQKDAYYYYYDSGVQSASSHVVSYINGVYYTESFVPSSDGEYEEFCSYINLNAADFVTNSQGRFSVYLHEEVSKAFREEFLGSTSIFNAVCKIYGDEIVSAVRENASVPKADDTVMVQINDGWGEFVYAAVGYEETVKPLVEKYLASSLACVEDFRYSDSPEFIVKIYPDGINGTAIGVAHYYSAVSLRPLFEEIIGLCGKDKELYTADGHLSKNVKGKSIMEITVQSVNYSLYHFYAYVTEDIEKYFVDEKSNLYSKEYDTRLDIERGQIVSLFMNDVEIKDPKAIEYFRPYIISMLTSGGYNYEYIYDVQAELNIRDCNDPETITTHCTWLPLSEEMYDVYKEAISGMVVK